MAKKRLPVNPANNIGILDIVKENTGIKLPASEQHSSDGYSWQRYTIVCDKELLRKVQDIAHAEGVKIREVVEHCLRKGVAAYERKHGEVAAVKKDMSKIM